MDSLETLNAEYIDAQYRLWKKDPSSVSRDWQFFFKGFEIAGDRVPSVEIAWDLEQALRQSRVEALIYRYRDLGHLLACTDPLESCPTEHPLLSLESFNFSPEDLEKEFFTWHFSTNERAPLKEIIKNLKETYCRSIGIEYMHLQDPAERRWLQDRMEPIRNHPEFDGKVQLQILKKLCEAAIFEQFLNKKYVGVTRFSLEGAIILIPTTISFSPAISICFTSDA